MKTGLVGGWLGALGAVGVATGAALWSYARHVEPFWLDVRRVTLELRGWPIGFDGLTVLHLSDLHAQPNDAETARLVRTAGSVEADLLCLTGDFGELPRFAPAAQQWLRGARGRLGTFAVLGNHDFDARDPGRRGFTFSSHSAERVAALLEAVGVTVLRNESVRLARGQEQLWIVGLDDPHTFHDDVARAYRGVPSGVPSIALMHSWEPAPRAVERGARLVLAGHTHGGQVRPPFLDAPIHNTHRRPPRVGGLSRVDDAWLHISHGLGSHEKLRFLVRPQAVLFTLRGSAKGSEAAVAAPG